MAVTVAGNCGLRPGREQHAGVEDGAGVEGALRRRQRLAEELGPLGLVPGHVIAANGMVVGDRPAPLDQCVGGRPLDRPPLLDLGAGRRVLRDR